ncbi:MAG: tetratricopeptide repeat protein, partial [Acidimicrobiia bacterium]
VMDWALFMLGRSDEAVHSQGALEIFQRLGNLQDEAGLSTNLGAFAYFDGDWAKAIEYYEIGREASERAGNTVDAAVAAANLGEVLVNQGRWGDALEPLSDARRIYSSSDFGEGVAWADQLLGRLYGVEGDIERSVTVLEASVDLWRSLGMDASGFEAAIPLADARCRAGDPDAGLATLDEAESWVPDDYRAYYEVPLARTRGSILEAADRRDEAAVALAAGLDSDELGGDVYESALLTLTMDKIAPDRLQSGSADAARETLRTLGVGSVPGIERSSAASA